jgi:hypothetical protein
MQSYISAQLLFFAIDVIFTFSPTRIPLLAQLRRIDRVVRNATKHLTLKSRVHHFWKLLSTCFQILRVHCGFGMSLCEDLIANRKYITFHQFGTNAGYCWWKDMCFTNEWGQVQLPSYCRPKS